MVVLSPSGVEPFDASLPPASLRLNTLKKEAYSSPSLEWGWSILVLLCTVEQLWKDTWYLALYCRFD
jgi:hypothetical protein